MDLLGLVKDQLSSAVVSKIGSFLGESPEKTTAALGSAVPSILGGLIQKASTTQGAGDLLSMIKDGSHDGNSVSNFSNLLGGGSNTSGLISAGSGILSSLFGNKVGALTSLISSVSGLGGGSASSLLSMAAPLIMGVIGKHVGSQGLNASGLSSLLSSQSGAVKAALPAGFGNILNVDGLGSTAKATVNQAAQVVEEEANGLSKYLPWLLLGLLALGALYYFKSCRNTASEVGAAVDTTAKKADSVVTSVADVIKKKLSTGTELSFGKSSIENELIAFIEDSTKKVDKTTWFNFRDLKFKTGSAQIDSTSMQEVRNINEILKAYPNVAIKVGGYTDNVGKAAENMKLSQERANNVAAALGKLGSSKQVEKAEGYGQANPIASNDTDAGRAQNRRISVRVTKK